MQINHTCAFTGHRDRVSTSLRFRTIALIREAAAEGYTCFISGAALGYDLFCAQAVLALRNECAIRLVCAVPFSAQAARWNSEARARYARVLEEADEVIVLSEEYTDSCLLERNRFMVESSSLIIANYDGRIGGGTYHTINLARRNGIEVRNCRDE